MKQRYILLVISSLLLLNACSKDFLKSYDKRIVGTWHITDVNTTGFGGDQSNLPFRNGQFTFNADGSLVYTSPGGQIYNGTWNIQKKSLNETSYRSLEISAVNFTSQAMIGEYYDDMEFISTDHFKAKIIQGLHTYVTHFKR